MEEHYDGKLSGVYPAGFCPSPVVAVTALLTLAVILVNGWTDAPNAIATCVSTRSIRPRAAILMAAVFNFLGVFVMTAFNARVATTIYKMVDFGENTVEATQGLCAGAVCDRRLGNACLVLRDPDQRKPRPDRRALRRG